MRCGSVFFELGVTTGPDSGIDTVGPRPSFGLRAEISFPAPPVVSQDLSTTAQIPRLRKGKKIAVVAEWQTLGP